MTPGTERVRAHAFVADVDAPHLESDDRHHLARVLCLRPGELISVADGAGRWRRCRFGPAVEPVDEVRTEPRPAPLITIAFGVTKGERPDWAVQKVTELGADRIVPFVAARSVVRWDPERAARHVERWRRIAREAAGQSRRAWLPEIDDLRTFAEVLSTPGVCLAEAAGGGPPRLAHPVVLVGPEGGWAPEELEAAAGASVPRVRLGDHVLRAETAAATAAALLCGLRSEVVRERPV